jgi:light-regulated signal transduction histidine kinase (bacteriophytochrome)
MSERAGDCEPEQGVPRDADELESLVRERTEALERTNRELESFAYSVSHDLRSPLRSVLGYSAALEEDFGDRLSGEARDYLRRITAAAHPNGQADHGDPRVFADLPGAP